MTAAALHPGEPPAGLRRTLIRAAFAEYAPKPAVAYRWDRSWSTAPPRVWGSRARGEERLVVVVPTVGHGRPAAGLEDGLRGLADAAAALARAAPALRCLVAVALHDTTADAPARATIERLEATWETLGTALPWVGLTVSEPSKVLALNCTVPLLDANAASAIAWFDDDVDVAPDCLRALWRAFAAGKDRVYGARAVPARAGLRAGLVAEVLRRRGAAGNLYPYGCSMLVSRATFGDGIPLVYMSDDHYFLLSRLDPGAADPLHRLTVVPDALVRIGPARSLPLALRRVVRNYRSVQRVLADAEPASARVFRRRLHFAELRPPRAPREAASPRYWLRLGVEAGRAALWHVLVAELLLRGLLRRPRPALWSSDRGR